MKLTKANVRKIQLKTRNYKCSKDLTDLKIALDYYDHRYDGVSTKRVDKNEKYKKVITWLKNTFEITLDSKVRISDGTDCIQAFPIDLKTNEVIYDLLKEVLE